MGITLTPRCLAAGAFAGSVLVLNATEDAFSGPSVRKKSPPMPRSEILDGRLLPLCEPAQDGTAFALLVDFQCFLSNTSSGAKRWTKRRVPSSRVRSAR